MNSPEQDFVEVNRLIELAIEGSISTKQCQLLNDWIVNDPAIRRHYCEYIQLTVCIERLSDDMSLRDFPDCDIILDHDLWNQLAREEKTAPEFDIPQKSSQQELIQKVVYPPREKRKLSKFSIFMLFNAAAIILFFVVLRFAPPPSGIEVATLADTVDAKWANVTFPMEKGTRLTTGNERLLLRNGYVELLFDNQTRVTVEGPAEFQILTDDRVCLNYGKAYIKVSKDAIGFSVYTKNAKIIDMGTEFGVLADFDGSTQLHVLKGKTMLMAGKAHNVNMEVSEGDAKKISDDIEEISDIQCRSDYFVREINSESNLVWKGQKAVDLTDIIGGGNGFGSGSINMTINPTSGEVSQESFGRQRASNDYHPVPSNPCIDGVFVPDGRTPQTISSQGHLFRECPQTSGLCCEAINNNELILDARAAQIMEVSDSPVPSLLLHANMGVTFDLQEIRRLLPERNFVQFQSIVGIRQWALRPQASNADFWVLVDGKLKFKRTNLKIGELCAVNIGLSEQDRFLTLIETDGGDPDGRLLDDVVLTPIDSDWGMFAEPVLLLE